MKNTLMHRVLATVLISGALTAGHAATLDTTTASPTNDGVLQNFTGFDWHQNGGGWVRGYDLTGANHTGDSDTFTLTYQAFAGVIATTSPVHHLSVAYPGSQTGTYELTTYATAIEKATCLNNGCTTISLSTIGGNWDVYFDTTPDANQALGTGFRDGAPIISGTWDNGSGAFTDSGPIGPGAFGTGGVFLIGSVTSTNSAYVNPMLVSTTLQASLQYPGQTAPTFTRPAAFDGVATGSDTRTNFVIQMDSSQNLAAVPEPSTAVLFGLGLAVVSLAGFRRR